MRPSGIYLYKRVRLLVHCIGQSVCYECSLSAFLGCWHFSTETSPTGQRCVRAMSVRVLTDRQTDEKQLSSKGGSKNMLVDHLFQYRISPRPKTAKKHVFYTCVTDIRTDGPTDRRTDGPTDGPTDGQTLL